MAFPRIFERLFQNNGEGPLLRPEIIPSVERYEVGQYYLFEDDAQRPGLFPCLGGVVTNFSQYPRAVAYFQTAHGQKRLVTQAQYDALHVATWHTNADGTKVGWNGIGGVNKFVWDKSADTLRLPDLADMFRKQIGGDTPGVGGVHGDAGRNITGTCPGGPSNLAATGPYQLIASIGAYNGDSAPLGNFRLDTSRVSPVAAKNQPRAWGSLACVYLG